MNIQRFKNMKDTEKIYNDSQAWKKFLTIYSNRLKYDDLNSSNLQGKKSQRISMMNKSNPTFILRNWIAQDAIASADSKDFSKVRTVLKMLETPFLDVYDGFQETSNDKNELIKKYTSNPPLWAEELICTCSS